MSAAAPAPGRLQRLLGFLDHDPGNLALIADAAETALDEAQPDTAWDLLGRYEAEAPLTPQLRNLKGLAALGRGGFAEAADTFGSLVAENPADPAIRFNLASAHAMLEDDEAALAALDDEVTATVPNAPALKIHTLHHLGRLDEALDCGAQLALLHPNDAALMGALATAAIDAEDLELARTYAMRAGDQPEGLAAAGMVMLGDDNVADAMETFDRALAKQPDNPRAAIGKGLALMACEQPRDAAKWLDQGAEAFGTHLGTWIASAWAYFVQGDLVTSRQRFETALAVDDTFAETHGGLAVIDIAEGDLESARRRTDVALRLDRRCFAGALARSLLLEAEGDASAAHRIRDVALNMPMGESGKTLAQAMAAIGAARRPGASG